METTKNSYATEDIPKKVFMGFGYNGNLRREDQSWPSMERLDMLQYFAYMFALQQQGISWTIWDASSYQIVNVLPKKKVDSLGENPRAENVLDAILSEFERPKRAEIRDNCKERLRNLCRFSLITGVEAPVYNTQDAFMYSCGLFTQALGSALEYVAKLKVENPDLVSRIQRNGNPGSWLYLPLEIAEAMFLETTFGVKGKFGPRSEQYFDECILGLQEERGIGYTALWCPLGPRPPGYLKQRDIQERATDAEISTKRVLLLCNWDKYYENLLADDNPTEDQNSREYRMFVKSYLEPFRRERETTAECAIRLKGELGGRKESFFVKGDEQK
ncbi:MAG TPA: hypothetical protein VJJ79_02040 [Candidatus Nanoarchaeia archaeon]|nr:hypothetical protein [Candidatus Nanoarchaeia archaeon]